MADVGSGGVLCRVREVMEEMWQEEGLIWASRIFGGVAEQACEGSRVMVGLL
jgi:hypothetical protein